MIIRLLLINETEKARRYETNTGEKIWIPKSVVKSTVKFSNEVHELVIEDWWWDKHNQEQDEGEQQT